MSFFIDYLLNGSWIEYSNLFLKKIAFFQCIPFYLFFCGLCGIVLGRKNLILVVISLDLLILVVVFYFLFIFW